MNIPKIIVESPVGNKLPYVDDSARNSVIIENERAPPPPFQQDQNVPPHPRQLRRNSISLPSGLNDLDLELLREAHKNHPTDTIPENGTSTSNSYNESDEEPDNRESAKVPLRNARRKSMAPGAKTIPSDDDDYLETTDSNSPANSITSVNSLASLLKEKMQMFPSVLKKKKQASDFKVRAFVAFLFLSIVFLVGIAYVFYHQKVLQRAYFEKIKFNKMRRSVKIFNPEGVEIIRGELGRTIDSDHVYHCLPEDEINDGSICLEWMHRARLYLNYKELNDDVRCYSMNWISLASHVAPTDCFDWSPGKGHWYGGGQTAGMAWPLEDGSHNFTSFVTGDADKHQWGNVLKRYFIGSKGAAIIIDNESPLYVSINAQNSGEFCLKARHDDFAYVNHKTLHPHLNYSICTSANLMTLHAAMTEKSLWDGLKKEDMDIVNSLLSEPVWEIAPQSKYDLTESAIYNYTEDIIALGFLRQGHVLINEFWQENVGDFTLDMDRFPTLKESVNIIHRRGFRIVFSIQPFISTESTNFAEGVKNRLLISERFSDRRIPALTRYKSLASAGVLDFTKNETFPWLHKQLKSVMDTYNIDAFYLDLGTAFDMPHYYQCEIPLTNPDQYKTLLISSMQGTISLVGVSSAIQRPRAPIFVSLPPFKSTWKAMKTVIPTILTYGITGYPFVMPGAVGGDVEPVNSNLFNITSEGEISLSNKELYVRWLQLATFLPVIRFTHLPSKYGDQNVLEMAKRLTSLRQQVVTPLLKKYAREALDSGLPLIRPLWMLDPNDPACHMVVDEFSVGEELIVAPVLLPDTSQREIYLPAGVWKDGIDGSLRKGSRWIHNYRVLEDQVAYFVKMPNNTRF